MLWDVRPAYDCVAQMTPPKHVNQPKHSITDMRMYTSPQAKQFLLHEGLQTTTNILPIAFCQAGHEVHHYTGMYNLWVRNKHQNPPFFLPTFDTSVFKPHLSLENRDPLNSPFFMLFIQSTWLMYLPCSSNRVSLIHSCTCTLKHCLASVLKVLREVTDCNTNKLSIVYKVSQ